MAIGKREGAAAEALLHAERVLVQREAALLKAKAFLAHCEAARDEAQQCVKLATLNVELAKPFRACFGVESKGLGLRMTSFLTSVETTWLRATGKWFEESFVRRCGVERGYVCFERGEDDAREMMACLNEDDNDELMRWIRRERSRRSRRPLSTAQRHIKEIPGANSLSPLKCFKVFAIGCAHVFEFLGTLGEALSKNSDLACLTFTSRENGDSRGVYLCQFSEEIRNCPYVAALAIENTSTIMGVCESLIQERDFRMAALEIEYSLVNSLYGFDPNFLDHDAVLTAVAQSPNALDFFEEIEDRNRLVDREIMVAAVKADPVWAMGGSFAMFEPDYTDDYEVVSAAVRTDGEAICHASERLRKDPRIVRAAVTQNGMMLGRVEAEFKRDEAIVLAAVTQNGMAIQHADKSFRESRTIAAAAVESNGLSLAYFPKALRLDNAIALTAVRQNALAIQFAWSGERTGLIHPPASDLELATAAVSTNGSVLKILPYRLRLNYDICMAAVQQDGLALEFVAGLWKHDKDIIEAAVKQNPLAQKFIAPLPQSAVPRETQTKVASAWRKPAVPQQLPLLPPSEFHRK